MAGYLIRVGLDSGEIGGGGHAPIEYDGNFDYIPIPEDADTTENTTYDTFSSRIGIDASDHTDREGDATLHHDPKFEPSYTYGEVGTKNVSHYGNSQTVICSCSIQVSNPVLI
jgi:hypothetical protein